MYSVERNRAIGHVRHVVCCWANSSVGNSVGSKLSLPGRAELKKLGPPFLPLDALGRSAPALVGAKALNVSCMTHCQVKITCQLPVTRQA